MASMQRANISLADIGTSGGTSGSTSGSTLGGTSGSTLGGMQTTGVNYTLGSHQHTSINTASTGTDLMDVINSQGDRIEELEKLVQLLVAEVLPERAI